MKNLYKKIMIVFFALFLIAMPILTFIYMPKEAKPFSENENKYLAGFPSLSLKTYKNGTFMTDFDDWLSDRFFARENWIVFKNKTDMAIGKDEINGVFIRNNMMMQVWKDYDEELLQKNIKAINKFIENHPGIDPYFMLVPNAQEIYSDDLPNHAVVGSQKEFIDNFYDSLTGFNGTIDVYSALAEAKKEDSYIYYRTDHHWTSYGAYLGYKSASEMLNYTPKELDDFSVEHASNEFRGTLFSKTLDFDVTPDTIDYYTLKENEPKVKVSVYESYNNATGNVKYTEYDSMYFREFLNVKDKYSSFLGQNSPIVTVESDLANNDRSLLIIKDSYAHSIVPFLAKEYSKITMIDLRYINSDLQLFVSLEDYDQLLFLYNVITLSDDENIIKLNLSK